MRVFLCAFALLVATPPVRSAEISSAYTDIVGDKDCTLVDMAGENDGDWSESVCAGYRGYPVILSYGDARDSVFFGFPPEAGRVWETFSGFNTAGSKVEWRIEKNGDRSIPFATILRWSVSADPEDSSKQTEVLVVAKVGQLKEHDGCVIGLVVASGNPKANETARKIADEQARNFQCGADERVLVSGDIPLPEFSRSE